MRYNEIMIEAIQSSTFYHGTSARRWNSSGSGNFNLYLTTDRADAVKYAEEAVRSKRDKPIVVEFQFSDLKALSVTWEPDWGWVDAQENDLKNRGATMNQLPTWQESLAAVGSFCLSGFTDAFKRHGKITPGGGARKVRT